jgi:hypothetical protein
MDKTFTPTKEDAMTTAYVERANGRYEAWTYSDGERVMVARWYGSLADLERTLRAEGYSLIIQTYAATYKGKPVRVTIPENEEG